MSRRDLLDQQTEAGDGWHVHTATAARNLGGNTTPRGTRMASAMVYVHRDGYPGASAKLQGTCRAQAEERARLKAITAWELRWGPLPWERATFKGSHLDIQVTYQISVEPDEDDQ